MSGYAIAFLAVAWLGVTLIVYLLVHGGTKPESPLFDRARCLHCGTFAKRGTGCPACGTWVGR